MQVKSGVRKILLSWNAKSTLVAAYITRHGGAEQAEYIIFGPQLEKLHSLRPAPTNVSWVPQIDCSIGIAYNGSITFWNADTGDYTQQLICAATQLHGVSLTRTLVREIRCSLKGAVCIVSYTCLSVKMPDCQVQWLSLPCAAWHLSDWCWSGNHILCISNGMGPVCGQQHAPGFVLVQVHAGLATAGAFTKSTTEPQFSPCGIYLVYACRGSELIIADMKLQEVYHNDLSMLPGSPIRCSFSASGEQVWVLASNESFAPADASAHVTKVLIVNFSRGWQGLDVHHSLHACLTATAVTI